MKRNLLVSMLLIASITGLIAQPALFDFTPNNASGGIIATVEVNDAPAAAADFIAAFDEDGNCAGAVQLLDYGGQAFCNLQVYSNDATTPDMDEGIDAGETFTFKLWVSSTDEILDHPMDIEPVATWNAGLNGSPCPGYGFTDNVVLRFMGEAAAPDNDGDGFAGADDPDDTDPCNPDNNVTVCDTDGDGTPDGSDPYPTCAGTPDDGCDLTTDTFDDACVAVNTADCAAGTTFDAATCTCTTDAVPGCTDDTACNYDSNATEDDGSCTFLPAEPTDLACYETATANLETCSWDVAGDAPNVDDGCDITTDTLDDATCMAVNTPNCAAGESFDADACACTTNPVPGCTDANACNYDMNATEDDGSCVSVEAATIAGGPFTFCVGDDTSDFVSDITNDGGSGSNSAWVITDDQLNILGLPPMPGAVDFNAVAAGTCLIWYVVFEDITGANIGDNAGDLGGCFALSNSIEVIREQAGCTDPAASNYNPDAQCDDGSCETTSTGCTTPPSAGDFDCE